MSEIINGKEAMIALANGEEVEFFYRDVWDSIGEMIVIDHFMSDKFKFRLKPRTITINGIEVPVPFEPKEGDGFWHISTENNNGYAWQHFEDKKIDYSYIQFGAWRTEEEIKQVVSALRSVFKGGV